MHLPDHHAALRSVECLLVTCLWVVPLQAQLPESSATEDKAIWRALERRTSVHRSAAPLESVFRELQQKLGAELSIDWTALENTYVEKDRPVTVELREVPVETVLRTVLKDISCWGPAVGYRVHDGRIVVSAKSGLRVPSVRQTYAVRDLIPTSVLLADDTDAIAAQVRKIAEFITGMVEPYSWARNGGTQGKIRVEGPTLVIDHEPSVHDRITRLLGLLRVKPDSPTLIHPARASLALEADQGIRAALRREMSRVSYEGTPFDGVIRHLRSWLAVNIHVQWQHLEDAGLEADKPTTLDLRDLPAERVLQLVLEEAAGPDLVLAYEVRDGVLMISTSEAISQREELWAYPLPRVLRAVFKEDFEHQSSIGHAAQVLADVIVQTVAPDSWMDNGGRGVIRAQPDILFVRNASSVCDGVSDLLRALESVSPGGHIQVTRRITPPSADDAIKTALERVISHVAFTRRPLNEVVVALVEQLGIVTLVDWQVLEDAGVERDAPVSLTLPAMPASRVLQAVLDRAGGEVGLGFDVRDGVLVIATREWLWRRAEVHVHRAADLIIPRTRDAAAGEEPIESVIRTIVETIEAGSWAENGGRGTIKTFGHNLVVQNSPIVCRAVAEFLRSQSDQD